MVEAAATPPTASTLMVEGNGSEPQSGGHRGTGIVLDVIGGGLVIASVVSFAVGSNKYSTEQTLCPNGTCANPTDLARANALQSNADGFRAAGTGMLIGGGVALAIGTVLIITGHHSEASHVSLQATPHSAGLAFTSGF